MYRPQPMASYRVLDTFPAFDRFWRRGRSLRVDQAIESWWQDYLRPWPELFRKQVADYRHQGIDWRQIARGRVFPTLDERLPRMRAMRTSIRRAIPVAVRRSQERLGLDFPLTFVIHVGIGCGAGWATTFDGRPAVLLGLENAAEVSWTDPTTAAALVAHEVAHLLHDRWRQEARLRGIEGHRGPWWQLYEEGFATYCELELGSIGHHHSAGPARDWLDWCRENRRRLASSFLRRVSSRRSVHPFFGSWNRVDGHINTGYYLGSEMIRDGRVRYSLREIACWTPDEVRRRGRASLRRMAAARG